MVIVIVVVVAMMLLAAEVLSPQSLSMPVSPVRVALTHPLVTCSNKTDLKPMKTCMCVRS